MINTFFLDTPQGYKVAVKEFIPQNPKSQSLIIASATGVKQTLYHKFSEFLSSQGIRVFTFDYGGIGDSKLASLKKFNTSASNWGKNDLEMVIQHVKTKHPDTPFSIMGHSIGGQLIGLAPSSPEAARVVLVAAQTGYWKYWKGMSKLRMFLTWHVLIPGLTKLSGYFPGKRIGSSEDLPKDMALEWMRWCRHPNYLFAFLPNASESYQAISCPLVSYSAQDDDYAPKVTVDWLTEHYSNATIERNHLIPKDLNTPKIGHFGFFRSKNKEAVWGQLLHSIQTTNQA